MPNTPTYGWRYQHLLEAPHGPNLGEHVALDIETTVVGLSVVDANLDARLDVLEARLQYRARQTLGAPAPSVSFSSIPSTLRRLSLSWTARSDNAAVQLAIALRVNGNSGANYNAQVVTGNAAVVGAASLTGATSGRAGTCTGSSAAAGIFGSGEIIFVGWDSPHSTFLGWTHASQEISATPVCEVGGGAYSLAGPYTSVTLLPSAGSFTAGSDFQLIGEPA